MTNYTFKKKMRLFQYIINMTFFQEKKSHHGTNILMSKTERSLSGGKIIPQYCVQAIGVKHINVLKSVEPWLE